MHESYDKCMDFNSTAIQMSTVLLRGNLGERGWRLLLSSDFHRPSRHVITTKKTAPSKRTLWLFWHYYAKVHRVMDFVLCHPYQGCSRKSGIILERWHARASLYQGSEDEAPCSGVQDKDPGWFPLVGTKPSNSYWICVDLQQQSYEEFRQRCYLCYLCQWPR